MNKKNIIIIGIILLTSLVIVGLYGTFASSFTTDEGDNVYSINLSDASEEIAVPAGESKTIYYQVTNTNKGKVQYGIVYSGNNIDVKVYYDSASEESGVIDYGETKFVKLYVTNTGTSDSTANLKTILGYEKGGSINNLLPSGYSFVTETSYLTAYAVYSEYDNSLSFYKTLDTINVDDDYNGKPVTAVFTGFETVEYTSEASVPWYNYRTSIIDVYVEDVISPVSTAYWFYNFTNCTSMNLTNLDTSNVTSMKNIFFGCSSLESLDVSSFDTSKVTTMMGMFQDCTSLTSINFDGWDTSNVKSMGNMFNNCTNLTSLDLSNFNTSNVTNMQSMFHLCRNLISLNLSNFVTLNVTSMQWMFRYCNNLISLDISNFDTTNVTNMNSMFSFCNNLKSLNVSDFNTSNVTDMSYMFNGCNKLTSLDVSGFSTSNVNAMSGMFINCSNLLELDLSSFNTANVTNMYQMFVGCGKIQSIYVSSFWNVDNVTNSASMFGGCKSLVGGNGTIYNSSYHDKTYARIDTEDTPGYLTLKV